MEEQISEPPVIDNAAPTVKALKLLRPKNFETKKPNINGNNIEKIEILNSSFFDAFNFLESTSNPVINNKKIIPISDIKLIIVNASEVI